MPYRQGMTNIGPAMLAHVPVRFPGRQFFVGDDDTTLEIDGSNSGYGALGSESYGLDPYSPFSTIEYCQTNACVAGRGDVIYVMPGTSISISAAAGLDLDVAGISIIGLGNADNRPVITWDTATSADMDIDAAGITIENMTLDLTGFDAVAAAIDVNAADFTLRNCRIVMSDGTAQATVGVLTDAAADRMLIENCQFVGSSDAGPAAAIRLVGCDEATIRNCTFTGDYSVAPIEVNTTAATNMIIENNRINNLNASDTGIELIASSSGLISHNLIKIATDGQLTGISTERGACALFENYQVNADGERGIIIGTAST